MTPDLPPRAALVQELVAANHILADQGIVDGFGHMSVRLPDEASHFLPARPMAPALVEAGDIITYDLDGNGLNAGGRTGYLERHIHSEVYRSLPDVMAIVHSHTPSALPFFVSRTTLRPGYHMSAFLAKTARCEISKDFVDATDMLISNAVMGRSLAKAMDCACVTLMRGHGLVAVGRSLQEAVYRAICTYVNARVQTQAMALDDTPASAGPTW